MLTHCCTIFRIVFSSIMPSGAEKWFNFLKNFNKLIDQKYIKAEREKQIEWVEGVVKGVKANFQQNPIALRLNLNDLLKTNVTLTKAVDLNALINPENVEVELRDLSTEIRNKYLDSINAELDAIHNTSMKVAAAVTAALYKLSDAAMFHVTTQTISCGVVGSVPSSAEVFVGVPTTGPILSGNVAALRAWAQEIYYSLRAVLTHFLSGKWFEDRIFTDYTKAVESAGLSFTHVSISSVLVELRKASAVAMIALGEGDIGALTKAFDEHFMEQYAIRAALEVCARFDPAQVVRGALLVELKPSVYWEVELAVDESASLVDGVPVQAIKITQKSPPPPPSAWEEGDEAAAAEAGDAAEDAFNEDGTPKVVANKVRPRIASNKRGSVFSLKRGSIFS